MVNASTIDNQKKQKKSKKDIKLPKSIINITLFSGTERTKNSEENHASKGSEESGSGSKANKPKDVHAAIVENDVSLEADTNSSSRLFRGSEKLVDEYKYGDNVRQNISRDEELTKVTYAALEDYVNIDSHILCTPVIADINNDGVLEMIVAVSYFYDNEFFDNPEHLKEFDGVDLRKYVAGSIVVFDLDTKQVKWTTYLDESTDSGKFPAYIFASPTVVDLDGDGNLDILVGTSYGYFYALDHKGKVRHKFPRRTAGILGAVVAADINDDGKIELVTTDIKGSVIAWTSGGRKVWETHLKSPIQQGPTIGDVDGDGHADVVVPTLLGNIFVLRGKDGLVIHPYPYRTHGRVMNRILLVDLNKTGEKKKGLTIVATSSDGYLYLIDGQTSCADVVDIGEPSYSVVVAENLDGGDSLDLIVTTMNGNVFCFSTPARFQFRWWQRFGQFLPDLGFSWSQKSHAIA